MTLIFDRVRSKNPGCVSPLAILKQLRHCVRTQLECEAEAKAGGGSSGREISKRASFHYEYEREPSFATASSPASPRAIV